MAIIGDEDRKMLDEDKVIRGGISREGLNVVKDNEFNIDTISSDRIDVRGDIVQVQGGLKLQQQQQSQGSAVCWEQFLHVTSIKVLLVENDDCTRHVVAALLRNCNYEVIEAANGVQAWKILGNLTNHIDLVLTEVVVPCLSGLGLLCKIMSHHTRKTIPVIMMSSHDSMGLVVKCVSKGAADFLVKPIRKNELKNLWQHVWRRCHSSSGSGSESGTQTQKSVKSKSSEKSENKDGNSDAEDNGGDGLNVGDGSDNESDTQSSWTKQAVEADSSLAVSPWNRVPESPDSTCAQVFRSNLETADNRNAHINAKRKCREEEKPDYMPKCKPSLMDIPGNQKPQLNTAIQVPVKLVGAKHKSLLPIDSNTSSFNMDTHQANLDGNCPSTEINNTLIDVSKESVLELSLKRQNGPKGTRKFAQDDRNGLRRSDLSAFSRFNSSSNPTRALNGITLSSSLIDNSQEVAKRELVCDNRTHRNEEFLHPSSNGTGNNIDMGSTTNKLSKEPLPSRDKSEATSTVNDLHQSSFFKPVTDFRISSQLARQIKPCNMQATTNLATQGYRTNILTQHPHQHHQHHHFHDLDKHCVSAHVGLSPKKLAVGGPSYASSNILAGHCEGNPEYYSLNASASGSNLRSNAQDGSSSAVNTGGTNVASDDVFAGKYGIDDASGSGCGQMVDPSGLARETASTEFSQTKKDGDASRKRQMDSNF